MKNEKTNKADDKELAKGHITKSNSGNRGLSRRDFLSGAAGAVAAFTIVPRHVLGGGGYTPPSEKVNVAFIGVGGQGTDLMKAILPEPDVNVVAVCDVHATNDYSKWGGDNKNWGYEGTYMTGREPGRKLVEDYYAEQKPKGTYSGCAAYNDFRRMLDKQKDIDAVVVATPDHTHAVIVTAAIKMDKHVYCEKPLAHSIYEVRKVTEAAHEAKVATQMGNHGHSGEGIRLMCEWIWDGAIGPVREVHAWTKLHSWTSGLERPKETPPVPSGLDWDLWLGPAPYRPYHPAYHPFTWRGWWDFGTGALADLGCHHMDPAFWALKLGHPVSVEASSTKVTSDHLPMASLIHYSFAARSDMPAVEMHWYDGGLMPERPEELEPGRMLGDWGHGILFVGEKGKLMGGGWGQSPRIIPETKMKAYKRPPRTLARVPEGNHQRDWLRACKGGEPACSNFDYAGPLTEAILLGNVAVRSGEKLYWDGPNMKVTNVPKANEYIQYPYRDGWTL